MIALKKRSLQKRFMNRIEQESLAGRFQSFDTELPPRARTELVAAMVIAGGCYDSVAPAGSRTRMGSWRG